MIEHDNSLVAIKKHIFLFICLNRSLQLMGQEHVELPCKLLLLEWVTSSFAVLYWFDLLISLLG